MPWATFPFLIALLAQRIPGAVSSAAGCDARSQTCSWAPEGEDVADQKPAADPLVVRSPSTSLVGSIMLQTRTSRKEAESRVTLTETHGKAASVAASNRSEIHTQLKKAANRTDFVDAGLHSIAQAIDSTHMHSWFAANESRQQHPSGNSATFNLPLELHLRAVTLQHVRDSWGGSLSDFMSELRSALSVVTGFTLRQLHVRGIHERYEHKPEIFAEIPRQVGKVLPLVQAARGSNVHEPNTSAKVNGEDSRSRTVDDEQHDRHEVVVLLQVRLKADDETSPQEAIDKIQASLDDPSNSLMHGNLGSFLINSTLALHMAGDRSSWHGDVQRGRITASHYMIVPIIVALALFGLILWLTARK